MRNFKKLLLFQLLFITGFVHAQSSSCELSISANDMIEYNKSTLSVPADCQEATLTLEHTGSLSVTQMGHNWVLTLTSDSEGVAMDGLAEGPENGYLPQEDERIIAHTSLIGGGESTTVTFDVSSLDTESEYTFFCSFPGHSVNMSGSLILQS